MVYKFINHYKMKGNRRTDIDVLRGIAIFLVIFGHITHISVLRTYIWGFHIPLFFFVSGYLFNSSKYASSIDFIKAKIKSLVIPYVFFYLFTFAYWVIIERHTRGADLTIQSQLIGMFYGTYDLRYMYFNGALWFLPTLFSMELLYWTIVKTIKNNYLVFVIMLSLSVLGMLFREKIGWLPWGLCPAIIGGVFLCFGNLCNSVKLCVQNSIKWIVVVLICVLMQLVLLPVTGAGLAALHFLHPIWYVPVAIIGIVAYYAMAKIICHNALLEWLGRNSLVLFALQEPVYRGIIFIVGKLLSCETDVVRNSLFLGVLCAVITVIIIMPMIFIWNTWIKPILATVM